jgi:hypothetical protein
MTFRCAIEVRHSSWFNEFAYDFFKNRLRTPTIVTSDFVYLLLIGDRRLAETQFGKIQIDRTEEIRNWG